MVRLAMVSNLDAVLAGQVVERVWLDVIEMIEERGDGPLKVWIFRLLLKRACRAALSPTNTGSRPKSPAVDPHVFMGQNTRWPGHWSAFPAEWSGFLETTTGSQRARDVVQRGIEALPFEVRRVVVLRDIEGWTASEVSELLGVSEGDQAGLLHEGRTQLRRDIAEEVLRP
ncbi:MAG: hypothetical protein M3256_14595 [Actinomycetota bacterium]|nr:hypothetical protein [Actinomycetota bacterium]